MLNKIFCTNGELAIKSEGMEDTFKDIAIYSTLAMILFRKGQNDEYAKKILSENGYADWEKDGKPRLESAEISMNDLREAAEKQQEDEQSVFQNPYNIDDDCLGTPKLKFKNKNVSNN